jgi:pimeloyl-ACP methyl ester carboxylesterase
MECRMTRPRTTKLLAGRSLAAASATLLAISLLSAIPTVAARAQETAGVPGPTYDTPLGIGLEGWPYPYPVHMLPLVVEGQPVRMAYMDVRPTGPANGRAILLLHGKNFDSSYWGGTIAALAQAGFRVIVPDQIGFNKSSKPPIDYSFDMLAANTMRLLNQLGVSKADVLGHSTGGMLAVRLARSFPDRVNHLVLEDPIGLEDYRLSVPPQTTETLYEAERKQTVPGYRAFMKRYFPKLPAAQYEPFVEWRARIGLSSEFDRYAMAVALTYQMIYRQPVRYEYHLLRVPVLLIVGEKDRTAVMRQYAPPELAAKMGDFPVMAKQACDEVPRCQLIVMPGLGHVPHMEAPEDFQRDLLAFLK